MPFQQNLTSKPVRDFVFPIGTVSSDGVFALQGTAFFLGSGGFAVTAGHVVEAIQRSGKPSVALFAGLHWEAFDLDGFDVHPNEDVGVVHVTGGPWHSFIEISGSSEHASCQYELWGYPEAVAHEVRATAMRAEDANRLVNPDLVYNRGYVRRRIARELPVSIYRGSAFYELSEVAGACCSGAPVVNARRIGGTWPVLGIYIGEETSKLQVGYAVRCDALVDWVPPLLGRRLVELRASVL